VYFARTKKYFSNNISKVQIVSSYTILSRKPPTPLTACLSSADLLEFALDKKPVFPFFLTKTGEKVQLGLRKCKTTFQVSVNSSCVSESPCLKGDKSIIAHGQEDLE
jgi:hypothetical protein